MRIETPVERGVIEGRGGQSLQGDKGEDSAPEIGGMGGVR